jgi:phenylacetic acid degradation operon negative regulatory protein
MSTVRNTDAGLELLERPLAPRSLVASLLLGMHPPRMPVDRLVRWCGLFGVAPGTARVALSRMRERGELLGDDGVYELAGRLRSRQPAQDWSLSAVSTAWNGEWRLAVVTVDARAAAARAALRDAMRRCRYAEIREGLWTRPDNLPRASAPADAWAVIDEQCATWRGRPDGDRVEVAAALFETDAWATRAAALTARARAATVALIGGEDAALRDGFVVGAATLQHIRNDALLPRELLPASWPGADLRDAYREYQRAFGDAVRNWFGADAPAARR